MPSRSYRLTELPKRILLVEDNQATRLMYHKYITELGYEVVDELSNGLGVVSACRRLQPDVIVMDVQMPHMDGESALDRLIESDLPRIGIVFITMLEEEKKIRELFIRGADAYVRKDKAKPIDLQGAILSAFKPVLQWRHSWKIHQAIEVLQSKKGMTYKEANDHIRREASKQQKDIYVAAEQIMELFKLLP